jgi:hypothetical protein
MSRACEGDEMTSSAPATTGARTGPSIGIASAFLMLALLAAQPATTLAASEQDQATAAMLAEMLRAVRSVVARHQGLINDATIGDKGLSGTVVLDQTVADFRKTTGIDPEALESASRDARLLAALEDSIREVVDENQETINTKDLGFKAFIPAVVGRLVSQRFNGKVGEEARLRVTAPVELIRNRTARPDPWEREVIEAKLLSPQWPNGQPFAETTTVEGREAYRVIAPEYYGADCLSCHGGPKGELDVTGYPKEGAALGQLGGAISITLFH